MSQQLIEAMERAGETFMPAANDSEPQPEPQAPPVPESEPQSPADFVDMLNKPVTAFDPRQFTDTIAAQRPQVFERLSEEMVTRGLPGHLEKALQNYDKYGPEDQQTINNALNGYIERFVEGRTGQKLNSDQIADIVNSRLRGDPANQPFEPVVLTYEIADRLGLVLDPSLPEHQQMFIGMQYRDWAARQQMARMNAVGEKRLSEAKAAGLQQAKQQFETKANTEVGKILNQLKLSATEAAKNPKLTELREEIIGWYQEGGQDHRAVRALEQYRREASRLVKQAPPKPAAPKPIQPTQPSRARTEEDAIEDTTALAVAHMRQRGLRW
jgi:hypothetical protein